MEEIGPFKVIAHDQIPQEKSDPFGIVIFGASGDLTHRKLMPALFGLYRDKLLPEKFFIIGSARTRWNDKIFRERILAILKDEPNSRLKNKFIEHVYYRPSEYSDPNTLRSLGALMKELNEKYQSRENVVFYFATPSSIYSELIQTLSDIGMVKKAKNGKPWIHAVFEKPFGHDLDSARELNKKILKVLDETQVYRIDHYLGKETVQNILMFRFANIIFESLWSNTYIDHVQITASETLGVEHRAGYYDQYGQLRDMFQNHMFQLMTLIAMEPPKKFIAKDYHDEKLKVAKAIRPIPKAKMKQYVVLGQYGAGKIDGRKVVGYRQEKGVPAHSKTDTFAAMKLFIDNPRWKGVPFYLRSGKRLNHPMTEIEIHFKKMPNSIFKNLRADQFTHNILSFRIQPSEGIFISFEAKYPGPKLNLASLHLDFSYKDAFHKAPMGPYERLLLDCIHGDQMLFVRQDMVEASWKFITSILNERKQLTPKVLPNYKAGSWGPEKANLIIQQDGRHWHDF